VVFDRYGDVIVGQIGTAGMEARKPELLAALEQVVAPRAVIWKNDGGSRELEGLPSYVETALGEPPEHAWLEENSVRFKVPLGRGQKTGWFYDQAANRRGMLATPGRACSRVRLLGAWGWPGAAARALASIPRAALRCSRNLRRPTARGPTLRDDAFDALAALRASGEKFDLVIVDPPAFVKRKRDLAKGLAAYRKLNQMAMQLLERDAILITCSCSHHLAEEELIALVQQSARHLARFAQVIAVGGNAPTPDPPGHSGDALSQGADLPGRARVSLCPREAPQPAGGRSHPVR
jgi:23S rRNA (cytosine1962-C5)-methyltransferase